MGIINSLMRRHEPHTNRKAALDEVQYREVNIRQDSIQDDERIVDLSFSSDTPIERGAFGMKWLEVLDHSPGAVQLSRLNDGGAVLMDHDTKDQIGVVDRAYVEGGKAHARIRFSKSDRGKEVFMDVQDGIRGRVSVGYRIHKYEELEGANGELDTVRITDWEPYEVSLCSVPADTTVGVGRSVDSTRGNGEMYEASNDEILRVGASFREREIAEDIVLRGGTLDDLKREILSKRNNCYPIPQRSSGSSIEQATLMQAAEFGRAHSSSRRGLLRAFGEDRHEQEDNAYRAGMWVLGSMFGNDRARKWCQNHGVRAMSEGVFTKGGATVPTELSSAIIDLQEMYGVARQECEIMPMNSDTLAVPRHTGGVTAYFVGENTEITDSDAEWDDVNLVARKLAAITRISSELIEDSVIDIATFLANEIGKRFAEKEDDCLWNGDGTSTYGGILGVRSKLIDGNHTAGAFDATAGDDQFSEIIGADLDALMGKLPQYALANAKWYCSQVCNQVVFQGIARAAGGTTMIETGNTVIRSYQGYPIVVSQKMPSASTAYDGEVMLLFGDLKQTAMMGTRRELRIRVLEERYADLDQLGIQGTERFDINVHDLGDNTTAGPMVGLLGNTS